MATPFTLRASGLKDRVLEAAKFRDRVPALETTGGTVPRISRRTSGRLAEQTMLLQAGGKKYEGTREMVGSSAEQASEYVVMRVDAQNGVMTMMPLSAWYAFRPSITHSTLGLEDAEKLLAAKDRKAARAEQRIKKMSKLEEDEEGGGAADAARGAASSKEAARLEEDDEFDDGAGPDWAAREAQEEDGNDGLDMEDEDLFDDDEDDGLGDDDEAAFNERQQAHQALHEQAGGPGRRALGAEEDTEALAAVAAAEEDDELEGAAGASAPTGEWGRRTKEDLRAERKARREAENASDDDDDDDELLDEGEEALNRLLNAGGAPGAASEAAAAEAKAAEAKAQVAAAAAAAGGKRALSPSGADDELAKRARQAKETAAQLARSERRKVEERDVVMLLHQKGKLSITELIKHFKSYMSSKAEKVEFIEIVKHIAYVSVEGDTRVAKLKEETLGRYHLFANEG